MTQKIIQVGNSAAVTIPKSFMRELDLKVGDEMYVFQDLKHGRIIFSKSNLFEEMTELLKSYAWLDDALEKYSELFRK